VRDRFDCSGREYGSHGIPGGRSSRTIPRKRLSIGVKIARMPKNWLSITVELVEGRGRRFWPRPGRVFAAGRSHTFGDLATAIDDAFARWDRSHLHEFLLADGTRIGQFDDDWGEGDVLEEDAVKMSRLTEGEQFGYMFDFGDGWSHLCTVGEQKIDPLNALGILPSAPLPYFGWGDIPDQYGRRFDHDDGAGPVPPDPKDTDLPPFFP
jgi:hypothetical protein